MGFMDAEMTEKQEWVMVDGDSGIEAIPSDLIDMDALRSILENDMENGLRSQADCLDDVARLVRDYVECLKVFGIEIVKGYGVRSSAAGYMDCTSWSVYTTKKEALAAARQEQRECDGNAD